MSIITQKESGFRSLFLVFAFPDLFFYHAFYSFEKNI